LKRASESAHAEHPDKLTQPALDALRALDPNELSPRQALEAIYRLQTLDQEAPARDDS
jgi:hypothetical protein